MSLEVNYGGSLSPDNLSDQTVDLSEYTLGEACSECEDVGTCSVGGIAELPEIAGSEAAMNETASTNYALWTVIAAGSTAGVITLAGAAWYTKRRWLR